MVFDDGYSLFMRKRCGGEGCSRFDANDVAGAFYSQGIAALYIKNEIS